MANGACTGKSAHTGGAASCARGCTRWLNARLPAAQGAAPPRVAVQRLLGSQGACQDAVRQPGEQHLPEPGGGCSAAAALPTCAEPAPARACADGHVTRHALSGVSDCTCWVVAVLQAPFLGERTVTSQGEAGPYHWMTYKQARSPPATTLHPFPPLLIGSFLRMRRDLTPLVMGRMKVTHVPLPSGSRGSHRQQSPHRRRMRPEAPLADCLNARQGLRRRHLTRLPRCPPQLGEDRTATGSGLLRFGVAPHQTVGIYSVNCTAWVMVAEACSAYRMVSVPLYDTLGPDAVRCAPPTPASGLHPFPTSEAGFAWTAPGTQEDKGP